ncbi:hypothetical protein NP511_07665 [Natrinema thermotolerans]|uniref:Uncharacterized protein n=1 Tax=Natrinema thermotolerans TaxID=121872 RepID=A0AAF0PE07_9EURY|nr:hypothetical protein [Natrinema thermotolerans]WMT09507.1 hypothetical protein NP511_07665 [Natrinema thermotolerans]
MDPISRENKFTYDGYLIFTPFSTTVRDENISQTEIVDTLLDEIPNYSLGTPQNPGKGIQKIPFQKHLQGSSSEFPDDLSSVIALRYKYEEFDKIKAVVDGSRRMVSVPNERSVDIYWNYPNYMSFRGAKKDIKEVQSIIRSALFQTATIDPIRLESDFFLWLFYQNFSSDGRISKMMIRITDVELQGETDLFGKKSTVRNSTDATKSIPILIGLLQNKSISGIEVEFAIQNQRITASIQRDQVQVKASQGSLPNQESIERIASSLMLLDFLYSLYDEWLDLPNNEKYPPLTFFEELYNMSKNQGVKVETQLTQPLKEYAAKRGEDPSDYGYEFQ